MATCSFCGRPTDRNEAFHGACRERHHKATIAIPGFLKRILDSQISANRFVHLLREAAAASFIAAEQLDYLCLEGVSGLVSDILDHRLVTNRKSSASARSSKR